MAKALWNLQQNKNITRANNKIQRTADTVQYDLPKLQQQTEKLSLVCHALWELLKEKTELTEADLQTKMKTLDAQDGKADQKYTEKPIKCKKCDRVVSRDLGRCIYCGEKYNEIIIW